MVSLYKHHAPSTTSLSDDGDDIDVDEEAPQFAFYPDHQLVPAQWANKRSADIVQRPTNLSPVAAIPPEIMIQIFKHIHSPKELYSVMRVSRTWCQCAVELLWHKPTFAKYDTIYKMARLLQKETQTFTYPRFVRRLNFLNHGSELSDDLISVFARCDRLERLTLIGCKQLTGHALAKLLPNFVNLVAIDLTGVVDTLSDSIMGLAKVATRLQGINLSSCNKVTDVGIVSLAQNCPLLRRVKLSGLSRITDNAVIALAHGCPMLLEIDLNHCELITDVSVRLIWSNLIHMREMRLSQCSLLTDMAFPAPFRTDSQTDAVNPFLNPSSNKNNEFPPLVINRTFENLRMLDLTACALITDEAVEGIVSHAPKIRNLVLSKCVLLTDKSVETICKLGRHLHYLHLGHASKITDLSVRVLARSCTRIRYIDFANCVLLTDMSVFELSALPKLRRVGLVRVNQLTDEAIYALAERHATLERIHLSYCDQISVMAIHFLLLKLHKLTHLSLTGVTAFRQAELQQFCREAPKDFNSAQRQAFCVFSGKGVSQLRAYLTELFDRITELSNTDDTEYEEDEFDGEGYQEDDTPEPEAIGEMEGYPRQHMLYNPNVTTTRGHPFQHGHHVHQSQPHEFTFQRDRPSHPNAVPPTVRFNGRELRPELSPVSNLQAATSRLNAQIQASTPTAGSSRLSRVHVRHGRTAADVLPIVESSQSSTDAIPNIPTDNMGPGTDDWTALFNTYQERPATAVSHNGTGVLTPDLNYAEIGHGRGTQSGTIHQHELNRELTANQSSTSRFSPAPEPPRSRTSRANSDSEMEQDTRRLREDSTPIAPHMNMKWTYQEPGTRELQESVQSALGAESSRGRREQPRNSEAQSDQRARSVKRGIRNTLHAAENYATSLLFGRNTGDPRLDASGSSAGSSGHGHGHRSQR
ncbi:RNI-like protein [Pholiota conissans]|uniref:RNI-like protein n=1 Tax=Pholiota conissans TaxID=109636 RepID=A0A9P5Z5J9_9AGAR|nr:RNI-like protein [Pholiota conissans]